ncbi:MAG: hypothetical protein V4591_00380 [Bdellovibrionota bacterium]
MIASRSKLIASIIKIKLYDEVDQILSISRQGFDVFAQVDFPEVKTLLIHLLEQELKINSREFRIIECKKELHSHENSAFEEENFMPTVLVGEQKLDSGYGFVHYHVRSPDQLLGGVAAAVEKILKHFNLEFYIDVFDAKKLSRLKQIAKLQGLKSLIDAVVQTAYYGGYKGDNNRAQSYLDKSEFLTDGTKMEDEIPLENCAKKFLAHAMTHGEDAHSFIKSCLSYFVISKQGHTMTRASQILSVSRTTLQEHLKIASQLGVNSFFEGATQK